MKEISILFTRHERGMGVEGREGKLFTFLSRTRILDHRILQSEVYPHSHRFLFNEPLHTMDT